MNVSRISCLFGLSLLIFLPNQSVAGVASSVREEVFGTTKEGETVVRYTLRNRNGMVVRVMNWGAIVTEILTPDREGRLQN
ncbi:galactose-1-epimerase, partial [bacterium]|nr:galactose-1-epimerase [bacterium]